MRSLFRHIDLKNDIADKVQAAMVEYVFRQTNVATFASIFCASIIFIDFHLAGVNNAGLWLWFILFTLVVLLRVIMVQVFRQQLKPNIKFWRWLYIVTFGVSGFTWGLAGLILLPNIEPAQQMLLMLMVAGVTAGAVPLSSAIPEACISFLSCLILPFIFSIAFFDTNIAPLFNLALTLYYVYTIVMAIKSYRLVRQTVVLRFENDALLGGLINAKRELEFINQKLILSATHDPLTSVANRNLFHSNLDRALKEMERVNKKLALLYLDIDQFKQVNDTLGHEAGDKLLLVITDRLKSYLRSSDIIARMGGDEFTIILSGVMSQHDVKRIASDLCRLIALPVDINHHQVTVTASIGISMSPEDGKDAATLTRNADMTMYTIKSLGGNNIGFCSELADSTV